jgi:hypothetical protein
MLKLGEEPEGVEEEAAGEVMIEVAEAEVEGAVNLIEKTKKQRIHLSLKEIQPIFLLKINYL